MTENTKNSRASGKDKLVGLNAFGTPPLATYSVPGNLTVLKAFPPSAEDLCPECGHYLEIMSGYTKCPACGAVQFASTLTVAGSDMVDKKAYLVMLQDADGMIVGLKITDEKKLEVELGDGDAKELLARFHAVLDEMVTGVYAALEEGKNE